ncbi:MAG: hypothetical protein WAM60_09890 [Candidatus Promineifilaceae bacterium]
MYGLISQDAYDAHYLQAEIARLKAANEGGFFVRQLRRVYQKVFSSAA